MSGHTFKVGDRVTHPSAVGPLVLTVLTTEPDEDGHIQAWDGQVRLYVYPRHLSPAEDQS